MSNPAGSWWQGAAPRSRGEIRLHAGDVAGEGPCGVEDPWCGRARRPLLLAARDAPLPKRWLGVESFDRPGDISSPSLALPEMEPGKPVATDVSHDAGTTGRWNR
jgi:hypothetical protein